MINKLKNYFFAPRFHFNRFQFNLAALVFAVFGFLFATYFAAVKLPQVFALNDTTKTWTFTTENAGQFTYDTSLVTVDGTAHPITGVNKVVNPAFSADTSSWSLAAVSGSTTPAGWVIVPGNSTYSTTDFLAMKYEAKCAATSDLTTGLTAPDSGYHTYSDSGTACTEANSKGVVSVASGYPIANITQTNSITRCAAVTVAGGAAHLITNNEWMTVARNAEAQAGNWSLGSVGSGYLFAGHNDNAPALAAVASTTDTGNNACAYTDTDGTTEAPANCPTNTANNTSGTAGNQKRVFTLSNGSYVWDVSGNVWEWTSDTITEANQPDVTGQTGFAWREFTALTSYGTLSYDLVRPAGSTYDATYGVGRIYHNSSSAASTVYGFLRGGRWNSASYAGAFALVLSLTPANAGYDVGFRCASDPVVLSHSFSSSSGRGAAGGDSVVAGSVTDTKYYQSVNVGDTSTYDFSTYVYDSTAGNVGGTITSSIAQLYYNGATITTTYTDAGSGWWKLSGSVTGANASREYGVLVKSGKTVVVDDFTLAKSGTYSVYTTTAYSNANVSSWDSFTPSVTATGNATVGYQICLDDGSACSYSSGSRWQYYTGGAWTNATDATQTNTAAQLTQAAIQALPVTSQKISVKAVMGFGGADTPSIASIAVGLTTDTAAPTTNATALAMTRSNGGTAMTSNAWTNNIAPYFSWTAGADNAGGVGLKGYCLYIGTDAAGDPATSKGLLGTSPVSTSGSTCQFIVTGTSIDLATASYRGGTWLSSASTPYYVNVKAIDNAENIFAGSSVQFQFRFDNTVPTNTSYISCASGSFSNVADMNFSWPTTGSAASSDANGGLLGWQYQINSTSGTWLGTTTEAILGVNNYIPASESSRTLTEVQDGSAIVSGNNIVYFRSADGAGNSSSDGTIRTCNLSYGGAAPAFTGMDSVTVTPETATSNSYALSWSAATPTSGQTVAHYYYMVNTTPPSTLATLQGNVSTYIDNGTSRTVSATALAGVNKGSNTVYVVAIDDASTPNYSPSNYISGTFTLNSTDPDNVVNLVGSDSSIKADSKWYVTLTWTAPTYQGAGNLTYLVHRSTDGTTFAQVGTTSGLSYVDNTPASAKYYYKIYTQDGASAESSGTNSVSITPTGRYTTAPTLSSGPSSSSITTKKAKISWSTSRSSDSKVAFGTSQGSYNTEEPSSSSQVTDHEISLTGLMAGTTYYYKAKWTDEDGNSGESEEKSFSTQAAPTVFDVSAENVGLASGTIQYTVKGATKIKIYYGVTTSFGGVKEVSTSTSETTYTTLLSDLLDGTKYYYKINKYDSDGSEYEGDTYVFETLPRPKITGVRLETVANTAQTTIRVS